MHSFISIAESIGIRHVKFNSILIKKITLELAVESSKYAAVPV